MERVEIRAAEPESESESESAGVGGFDQSRSRSRSRKFFIDSDSGPESESVTALLHYFLPSRDGNKDGNRRLRANCRRSRWFVVYGALSAGVAFASGLILAPLGEPPCGFSQIAPEVLGISF